MTIGTVSPLSGAPYDAQGLLGGCVFGADAYFIAANTGGYVPWGTLLKLNGNIFDTVGSTAGFAAFTFPFAITETPTTIVLQCSPLAANNYYFWNGSTAWVQATGGGTMGSMILHGGTLYGLARANFGSGILSYVVTVTPTAIVQYAPMPFSADLGRLVSFNGNLYVHRDTGALYQVTAGAVTLVLAGSGTSSSGLSTGTLLLVSGGLLYAGSPNAGNPVASGLLYSWDGVAGAWTVEVPYTASESTKDICTFSGAMYTQGVCASNKVREFSGGALVDTPVTVIGSSLIFGARTFGYGASLREFVLLPAASGNGIFNYGGVF